MEGNNISDVDDSTSRSAGSSHEARKFDHDSSGFGGLSNFSAISDINLSDGLSGKESPITHAPFPSGKLPQQYVGEQPLEAFMDFGALARGVTIIPSTKMMR